MTDFFSRAAGTDTLAPGQESPGAPPTDYFSRAAGTDKLAQPETTSAPTDPNATPDASTWLGRRLQDVQGKQDPRYKDLPALQDALLAEKSTDVTRPMALSALGNSSDAQLGDIAKKQLGDRYLGADKDANGYDIVHYKGADGQAKSAYVNKPGLDTNDLGRAGTAAVPYMLESTAIGKIAKGLPLAVRAIGQASGAGLTSLLEDAGQWLLGSQQDVDVPKAMLTAAGAGVAEPVVAGLSALARNVITIPGLFDAKAGDLTAKGAAVAKSAGIDPAELSAEAKKVFASTYAKSADAAEAATRSNVEPFGIPATKGQISKDPYLLTQEEGMRRRLYGEQAQGVMRAFDEEQRQAVRNSALSDKPGAIGGMIAPGRNAAVSPLDANPATLGASIKQGLTTARQTADDLESQAWDKVGDLTATDKALSVLPDVLDKRLTDVHIDAEVTPAAAKMAKELDRFVSGEAPEQVAKVLKNNPVKTVDQMRRRLLAFSRAADTGEDKRAAGALYDGFNDWIVEAAKQNMLNGDPNAAVQMITSRGISKQVHQIFEPSQGGRLTPAGRRMAEIMDKADSPEGIVNSLLGSSGSRGVHQGTVDALGSIKTALDKFAPADVAKSTWDDIRLAYWTRQVLGKDGKELGPKAMLGNIDKALSGERSIVQKLYGPGEIKQIIRFKQALEKITYLPPNASGSGYTTASFIKEGVQKIWAALGLNTRLGQTVLEYSGLPSKYGAATARAAVNQTVKAIPPNLAPVTSPLAAAYAKDRSGQQ